MKILHNILYLRHDVGGPVRAAIDLTGTLAAAGHDVALMTTDDEAWPKEWPKIGPTDDRANGPGTPRLVKLDRHAGPLRTYSPRQMGVIRGHIQSADILHLHGVWELSTAQLAAAARGLGVPYCVSLRGMLDDWSMSQRALKKRTHLALFGRRMLEAAAFVHCTAQGEMDQASKWFPRGRGVVIPNLIDLRPYADLPGPDAARTEFPLLTRGGINVLFLSRVHYKKGIEVLLEAVAALKARGVEVNVLIAGSGEPPTYVDTLRRRAEQLGLGDRAAFLGPVRSPLKESLFRACDVFALPTSQENFGFVFYESLACGTPVVTTFDVDTWPELKASGGAVIVKRDAGAFADAITEVVRDPARRRGMGESGRSWVLKNLETTAVRRMFESAYQGATGGR